MTATPAPVASRERVAKVLDVHVWQSSHHEGYLWAGCTCGWEDLKTGHLDRSTWRTHRLDALLAAGVFRDEAKVKAEVAKRFRQDAIDEAVDGKLNLTAVIRMATEAGGAA